MLGIDENTLLAMRRGIGQYTAQYTQMAKAIGYNADAAAVSSNKFMTALSAFGQMAGMARDKIGSNLAEGLAGSLDNLRKLVLDNFPKIESAITKGVKGILVLAEVIGRVIFRLIEAAGDIREWWRSLDQTTRELIEIFGGLVIAWRILNSAFLTSPIGIITLLAASIIGLYDDYKTWKDGGKSLIDWGKWEPDIKAALKNIREMTNSVKDLAKEAANLFGIDPKEWSLKWEFSNLTHNLGELGKMLTMIGELLNAINEGRWADAASIGKNILKQGNDQPDAMPGVTKNAQETRGEIISWYQRGNAQLNQILPAWLGGSAPPPTVHGTPEAAMDIPGQNLPDRNNNPGNLRPVGGKGFRSFNSAIEGWDAMRNQLMRYFNGKTTGRVLKSITDIVSTWAPSSENDTGKYISDISKWMGVAPDAALNLNNPQVMTSLMQSMARKEGFSNWNSPLAAQAAGATVSQETNIHIHGVSDPERAGMAVAERQIGVNSRLTQQLTPGVK